MTKTALAKLFTLPLCTVISVINRFHDRGGKVISLTKNIGSKPKEIPKEVIKFITANSASEPTSILTLRQRCQLVQEQYNI